MYMWSPLHDFRLTLIPIDKKGSQVYITLNSAHTIGMTLLEEARLQIMEITCVFVLETFVAQLI